MKTANQILGTLWIGICGYLCISLSLAAHYIMAVPSYHFISLVVLGFFVLLYLAGAVASVYLFRGSRWGRIVVGIVALLTVMASVIGLFAFFDAGPYSAVGIAFDAVAFASACILLFSRRYIPA